MSTLAVTVACVTCIVKTGKLPSPPPSVFLRQMFVLTTKQRHISRNAALHGDAIGGGGAKPPIIAIVYGGNCFDAS